jgi:putative acetyltransferase
LKIRLVSDAADPGARSLVAASDAYLEALYPPQSNHAEPLEALVAEYSAFFVGDVDGRSVACGAVRFVQDDPDFAEIKRLFVDEEFRGRGLATAMVLHLERYARAGGLRIIRLEAGPLQPEALALYRGLRYIDRGPFGAYRDDPLSVFMEKTLSA